MPKKREVSQAGPADTDLDSQSAGPVTKRQRVSRACDQCRSARERCDGKPQCLPCVSQDRTCTYQAQSRKRGVQTGYIRTLEVALAWLFETVPDSEAKLHGLLSSNGQVLLAGTGTERLHKRWRKSRVKKGIERVLAGEELCQFQERATSADSGEGSDINGEDAAARQQSLHVSPNKSMPTPVPNVSRQDKRRLPPNLWALLDIYFSYTHCWFPLLEKQAIFQASYRYSSHGPDETSDNSPDTAIYAELWAALAIASCQNTAMPSHTTEMQEEAEMSPSDLYHIAYELIPLDTGQQLQVPHIKAILLLALINLGKDNVRPAWVLIGTAVQSLLDLTSSKERTEPRLRPVIVACFILDTVVSATYGKPPHLPREAMDSIPLMSASQDLDEWSPWTSCSGFGPANPTKRQSRSPAHALSTYNQLYMIARVVSDRPPSMRSRPQLAIDNLATLQQALDHTSPFRAFIDSPSVSIASVPSAYVLRMTYLWARTILTETDTRFSTVMLDTAKDYAANFGICGVPGLFTPYLSPGIERMRFSLPVPPDLHEHEALRAQLVRIWTQSSHPVLSRSCNETVDIMSTFRSTSAPRSMIYGGINFSRPSFADPGMIGSNPATLISETPGHSQPLLSPAQTCVSVRSSCMTDFYGQPKTVATRSMTRLSHPVAENTRMEGASSLAPLVNPGQESQAAIQAHMMNAPPDYDALLEDLAAIDYGDRIDADPQFMMNLGFAPGYDLTEMFAGDFGVS